MKKPHKIIWRPKGKDWTTLDGICELCSMEQHDITPTEQKQTKQWQLHGVIVKNKGCTK